MTGTSMAIPPLTIAVMSRQYLIYLGLQNMFERTETFHVVLHLHPWKIPAALQAETRPDVFILDMENEPDAIDMIKQIRESAPYSKIVLLNGFEEPERMRKVFASGVDGIILKVQPPPVVRVVIEALYAPLAPPEHAERHGEGKRDLGAIFKQAVETEAPSAWSDALTEREREIIRLVEQGLSNKEIAYRLSISVSTVRHHMTNIFDKVGVANRQKLLIHTHQFRSTLSQA
ncbi:MAG: response regulator transcription factor [Nitrospira sp.]